MLFIRVFIIVLKLRSENYVRINPGTCRPKKMVISSHAPAYPVF
jgi:hypothetical protein